MLEFSRFKEKQKNKVEGKKSRFYKIISRGVLALILAVAVGIFANGNFAKAEILQGTDIFNEVGRYKIVVAPIQQSVGCKLSYQDANVNGDYILQDVDLQLDAGATVKAAWIGYMSEGGSGVAQPAAGAAGQPDPLATFDVNFNGSLATQGLTPVNRQIATPPWDATHTFTSPGLMQYADITSLVTKKGSGKYQIANKLLRACPAPFMIAVEEGADFPYTNTVINNYFYSNTDNSPQNFIVREDLPANFVFDTTKNTKITTFGSSYDYALATLAGGNPDTIAIVAATTQFGGDISSAAYRELDASGKVVESGDLLNSLTGAKNAFYSGQSWNDAEIKLNSAAKTLELDIFNDGCSYYTATAATETDADAELRAETNCLANDGKGGGTEVAGFLALQIATEIDEDGDGQVDKCATNPNILASDPKCAAATPTPTPSPTPTVAPTQAPKPGVPATAVVATGSVFAILILGSATMFAVRKLSAKK